MRRVLHGDLVAMGRMLLAQDARDREDLVWRGVSQARQAATYVKQTGRWHPDFGDGSLASWASKYPRQPEPFLDDPSYAGCLRLILSILEEAGALREAG